MSATVVNAGRRSAGNRLECMCSCSVFEEIVPFPPAPDAEYLELLNHLRIKGAGVA